MNLQIIRYDTVGSTNDEAMNHAQMGAPEGLCIVAEGQHAGRGREGRKWHSEPGAGLYMSMVLRPKLEIRELPVLTLLTAIAVHDSVLQLSSVQPDIKWPNDILVGEKKISGILLETCDTDIGTAVIVGIGVNISNKAIPEDLRQKSTSIKELVGKEPQFSSVLQSVTHNLAVNYQGFLGNRNITDILGAWSARSSYATGKIVKVTTRIETFYGETMGLDSYGALRVKTEQGRVLSVTAGDVMAVRPDDRD